MSEHDVETLAGIIGSTTPDPNHGIAPFRAASAVVAAIEEGRWSPPGAARAGDALTEAERARGIPFQAENGAEIRLFADYTVEEFIRARAAGEAGGDLAERTLAEAKARNALELVQLIRASLKTLNPTTVQEVEWLLNGMADQARSSLALLDPAPADGSET